METVFAFINRMNLLLWIAAIFAFHVILYYSLGTAHWFATSLLATVTYAAVLAVLKGVSQRRSREPR